MQKPSGRFIFFSTDTATNNINITNTANDAEFIQTYT